MNLSETIGQQVRSLRLEKNMSLGQLAQISGISKVMLSQSKKESPIPQSIPYGKLPMGCKFLMRN